MPKLNSYTNALMFYRTSLSRLQIIYILNTLHGSLNWISRYSSWLSQCERLPQQNTALIRCHSAANATFVTFERLTQLVKEGCWQYK
jgi:hypothetical protein